MRISYWSSDGCSSDLLGQVGGDQAEDRVTGGLGLGGEVADGVVGRRSVAERAAAQGLGDRRERVGGRGHSHEGRCRERTGTLDPYSRHAPAAPSKASHFTSPCCGWLWGGIWSW